MKYAKYLLGAILAAVLLLGMAGCKKTEQYTYTVTFVDYDGTQMKEETVKSGESATPPTEPTREGYSFAGWSRDYCEVRRDTQVTAEYIHLTEMTLTVDTVTLPSGTENAEITVSIDNNPGVLGMVLTVSYDESVMALREAGNGRALSALTFQQPSVYKNGCNLLWFGSETGDVMDGIVLTLTFSLNPDAAPGEYPVTITYGDRDIYDDGGDLLSPVITQGALVIT